MNSVRVLIVEDDPMVASINKKLTEKVQPFEVIDISTTEEEAIKKIQELLPDLVLLDIFLANGSGLNLLQKIRKLDIPTDVILVTAAKDSKTIAQTMRYGAIDYIIKPFDLDRLEKSLKNYLKLRFLLNKEKDIKQSDLDKQLNVSIENEPVRQQEELPKGVHALTLDQILVFLLKQNQPLSCEEISAQLSMSKITVWRYLEYLVEQDKIKVELVYGTVGRPSKRYYVKDQ
ncbi:MAG: response regulator [Peptococcaceae bacterium]